MVTKTRLDKISPGFHKLKTKYTKVITLGNPNRCRKRNEPIRIGTNICHRHQARKRFVSDWLEQKAGDFLTNHKGQE